MSRLDIEAHVAPMGEGFGVRMKLKGASCPAVWTGQGWFGEENMPAGARMAENGRGWQFDIREDAETFLDTLRAEQHGRAG